MPKHATQKITAADTSSQGLSKRLREILVILMLAMGLFLTISLLSYHRADSGWSHTGYATSVHNAGGYLGAWFADLSLYLLGLVAYALPGYLFYLVWILLSRRETQETTWGFRLLHALGALGTLSAAAGLLSLFLSLSSDAVPLGAGGVLGYVIHHYLIAWVDYWGTIIILMALFLLASNLWLGIAWFEGLKWATAIFNQGLKALGKGLKALSRHFKQWLAKRATKAERKAVISPPPMVAPVVPPLKPSPVIEAKITPPLATTISSSKNTQKPQEVLPPKVSLKEEQVLNKAKMTLPKLDLLELSDASLQMQADPHKLQAQSELVEVKLLDFGIQAKVMAVFPGPVITRYELQLAPGLKVSKITSLSKDLARSLSVPSVRVVEVIPGKSYVGLELPNETRNIVRLRDLLASTQYKNARSRLSLALGKDIAGHSFIVDLARMPHLLVAGTTGSGKSVGLNAMLLSILYKSSPEDVRLIMIDPKMLELSVYEGIPHLLTPVVTDMKEAAQALRWCVGEMERRYKLMADMGVRSIDSYNQMVAKQQLFTKNKTKPAEEVHQASLSTIVIIIDELADMMMVVGKKVEQLIARIAQKARASGIHMILATQRPSVDVITGLIKSNIPTRIAFQVSSKIDSRTILDQQGAENLLGHGDMLYLPPGAGIPVRVHGAFVSDDEVHRVVADWKAREAPAYNEEVVKVREGESESSLSFDPLDNSEGADPLYEQAIEFITKTKRVSISSIQRNFKIGYNRAARMVEAMEQAGIVSAMDNGTREVIAKRAGSHA